MFSGNSLFWQKSIYNRCIHNRFESSCFFKVLLSCVNHAIVICKHCIIWKFSEMFNVYMSHNLYEHVHMYKEQYILPVFPLPFCFCSWLWICSICGSFWNWERKHLTITTFKTELLYKKAKYRMPVLTCAICWVLSWCQNCTSPVPS